MITRITKAQHDATVPEDTALFDPAPSMADSASVQQVDVLAEPIAEPTLDRYLDRSPKVGQPIDYPAMVGVLRRKRELSIAAEERRKTEKANV